MDVEQIVKMAQNGDRDALAALYEMYFDSLYIFIRSKVDGAERAEDICAEAFIKVFAKISSFSGKSSFKTWLYTIARNMVHDWYRSKSKRKFISLQNIFPGLEGKLGVADNFEVDTDTESKLVDSEDEVAQILQQLPPKYAEVLRLRFLADMSVKEVADVLDTSENNVKVMQNRAIKKAKEAVASEK